MQHKLQSPTKVITLHDLKHKASCSSCSTTINSSFIIQYKLLQIAKLTVPGPLKISKLKPSDLNIYKTPIDPYVSFPLKILLLAYFSKSKAFSYKLNLPPKATVSQSFPPILVHTHIYTKLAQLFKVHVLENVRMCAFYK